MAVSGDARPGPVDVPFWEAVWWWAIGTVTGIVLTAAAVSP